MPPLSAVAFDVDGTLVDSEREGHRVAFNAAFTRLGLPYEWNPVEYGGLLATAGGRERLGLYLRTAGHSDDEAEELAAELHRLKTERVRELVAEGRVPLRPGVRELVTGLSRRGTRVFAVTTGRRAWVLPLLERHFAASTFERVITGDEVRCLKPDPECYQGLLQSTSLAPLEVVAIEDSVNGLTAAKAAGLPCVLVRNEYTRGDTTAADLVVDGFGPGARRMSGTPAPMPHGRITPGTLLHVLRASRDTCG